MMGVEDVVDLEAELLRTFRLRGGMIGGLERERVAMTQGSDSARDQKMYNV